jgi:putative transposase
MPNKLFPNRRSIRLKSFDYAQEGAYFITITTQDRIKLFGTIKDQKMILNEFGKILENEWLLTPTIRPNISLGEFIIMPDHMHMIIHIDIPIIDANDPKDWKHKNPKGPSQTIGAIIRGFKGATTKKINLLLNSDRSGEMRFPFRGGTGELQFAPTPPESPSDLSSSFAPTESSSSRDFQTNKIWQRNYYEKIIFTSLAYENISRYIIDNPKNWTEKKNQWQLSHPSFFP